MVEEQADVTRAGPGKWTADAVHDRLVESASVYKRLAGGNGGPAMWAMMQRDWGDVLAQLSNEDEEVRPRAAQVYAPHIAQADEALAWVSAWVAPDDLRKLLWARAGGIEWWRLERKAWCLRRTARGYDERTLRDWWRKGLGLIVVRLNAGDSPPRKNRA